MFLKFIVSCVVLFSSAFASADSLKLVSPGSQSGGYMIQLAAYAKDLSKDYTISAVAAGNLCEALKQVSENTPTLLLWGNDYEAEYRRNICGNVPNNLNLRDMIRFNTNSYMVCSITHKKPEFLTKTVTGRIAHSVPRDMFTATINEINATFGTSYAAIPYNGTGLARLALVSGEVDYAILPNEHRPYIEQKGGDCFYVLGDTGSNYPTIEDLQKLAPTKKLTLSLNHGLFLLHASKAEREKIVTTLKGLHADCNSGIGMHTKCGKDFFPVWNITPTLASAWEAEVLSFGKFLASK